MADSNNKSPSAQAAVVAVKPELQDRLVTTEHRLVVGKKTLDYTATVGTVVLRDYLNPSAKDEASKDGIREADKARASFFFIAYSLKGVKKTEARPITFSFNGGPGSSSVW